MRRTLFPLLVFSIFFSFQFLYAGNPSRGNPVVSGLSHDHDDGHGHSGPLKFVQNMRQWQPEVRFRADILGGQAFLLNQKFVFVYQHPEHMKTLDEMFHSEDLAVRLEAEQSFMVSQHAYSVSFVDAMMPNVVGSDKMDVYNNIYLGNDQSKWASNVPLFETVEYQGLFPGVDLRVYSQELSFKYDFILQADADASVIKLQYDDVDGLSLEDGNLKVKTSVNEIIEQQPYAYQMIDGKKIEIKCTYVLNGNQVSFAFPNGYDKAYELVIDPVVIASTHSGSTATIYGHTATYDQASNCYVGGAGFSPGGLPITTGAFQSVYGGSRDICINKYNPTGSGLIFSTYIGGSAADYPHSMVTNATGDLYVLGSSESSNYPVSTSAFQSLSGGMSDIVVSKLNPTGTTMIGSTYFGGSAADGINIITGNYGDRYRGEIVVDLLDNAYVSSMSSSNNFPVSTGCYQGTIGGNQDGVLIKMNSNLSARIYATYIGGTGPDAAYGVVPDALGGAYITGSVGTAHFGTITGAAYPTFRGGTNDAYIAHLDASGANLLNATYFGTTSKDQGFFIEEDIDGEIYIYGQSDSTLGATTGRYSGPATGMFVAKFDDTLGVHQWTSNFGRVAPTAFLVDNCGYIYCAGHGTSGSYDVSTNAIQTTQAGFYLIVMEPNATAMNYGTYYGGSGSHVDGGTSRFDKRGVVYEATCTSSGFPTTANAYATANQSSWDMTIFKIDFQVSTLVAQASASPSTTGCAPFSLSFVNNSTGLTYQWDFDDGSQIDTSFQPSHTFTTPGVYNVTLVAHDSTACIPYDTATIQVTILPQSVFAGFTDSVDCNTRTVYTTNNSTPGVLYSWDMGDATQYTNPGNVTHTYAAAGTYTITLIADDTACNSRDTATASVFVSSNVVSTASASPTIGCIPFNVNFANAGNGNSYSWDFGNGTTSAIQNPSFSYNTPGTYQVVAWATDSTTCNISDSTMITIQVVGPPVAQVSPDQRICRGQSVTLYASGGSTYDWTPGGGMLPSNTVSNPTVSPNATTAYSVIVGDAFGCTDTANVNVEVVDIFADAGPAGSFCEGTGGAQLYAAAPQGGSAPYYYQWWCDSTNTFCGLDSVYDDDPIANPTTSTTYYLQITDANGCTSELDSTTVTVLPLPQVNAGPDQHICSDGAPGAFLTPSVTGAPGPFNYLWTPGAGLNDSTIQSPYARPDTTTIYQLIIRSSNGCESDRTTLDTLSTVTVVVEPLPVADAGPDLDICFGSSGQLQGFATGAGPNYNFQWSPSNGLSADNIQNPVASPANSTEYVLVAYSNGCPSYGDTLQVNVHTLPTPEAGPDVEICLGETATLDGDAWGDSTATYTYHWEPPLGVIGSQDVEDLEANPVSTTMYYVTATSSWGCESALDSAEVILKATPIAEAGPPLILCKGQAGGILQGSYYYTTTDSADDPSQIYYAWTPQSDLDDPTTVQPMATPTQSTWYTLNVYHNTCQTSDSVLVTMIEDLGATAFADTNTICDQDSVTLTGQGGLGSASFTWNPPMGVSDPGSAITRAAPGSSTVYQLIVEENGCFDSVDVSIEVLPTPDMAFLSSQVEGCAEFTINFLETSSNTIQYVWNFGDGSPVSNNSNPTHTYTQPGQYMVTLGGSSTGGCKSTSGGTMITVYEGSEAAFTSSPMFPVELSLPNTTVDFTDESANAVSWLWDFGDGQTSTEQNPSHTYVQPGMYEVTLTVLSEHDCYHETKKGPFIVSAPEIFIPNVFTPNGDGQNDLWMVDYTGDQAFDVTIYDRWGVLQYESTNKTKGWNGLFKGTEAQSGVYFYVLKVGDREFGGEVSLVR